MSRKYNNKILFIALSALIAMVVFSKLWSWRKGERTLRAELFSVDTALVTQVLLYPQGEGREEIKLSRQGSEWKASKGDISADADVNAVRNLLSQSMGIIPGRLAAKSRDKWKDFQVTDSLGTRVRIMQGDATSADFLVGKFSYRQEGGQMMGRGNIVGTSYLRLAEEEEVYATEGFLSMTFNQGFDAWRNKAFIAFDPENITKVTFTYPADSSFALEKRDSLWFVSGERADSAATVSYLNSLRSRNHNAFADSYTATAPALYLVIFEGNNFSPVTIKCFAGSSENELVLHSSLNPRSYFSSDAAGIVASVFQSKQHFLPASE